MTASQPPSPPAKPDQNRSLSALDATSIIVGTIIGSAIFMLPSRIAGNSQSTTEFFSVWILGGLLAFVGAICYAELATTYNEDGGDYVYLKKSFGRYPAFLFAWTCGWIFRPANIAAMAVTFATFIQAVFPGWFPEQLSTFLWSFLAITVLAGVNFLGIGLGKWTQNVLTFCKIGGLLLFGLIAFSALLYPAKVASTPDKTDAAVSVQSDSPTNVVQKTESAPNDSGTKDSAPKIKDKKPASKAFFSNPSAFFLALVFVMFTFGGWNDISFVAGEIKNPQKNLPLSLFLGISIVTIVYLLVNAGLIYHLGFSGLQTAGSQATKIVVDQRSQVLGIGAFGPIIFGLMVSVSCLGAINAMLITSPRLFYAASKDHEIFSSFQSWDKKAQTPKSALAGQYIASIILLASVSYLPWILVRFFKHDKNILDTNPFDELIAVSSPYFWLFLALIGPALIALRFIDGSRERPFRTWGYPISPLIFTASGCFLLYSSLNYVYHAKFFISFGIIFLVFFAGCVIGFYPGKTNK